MSCHIWFVAWDISDENAAMTGRVILSVPDWKKEEHLFWDNRRWKITGAVKSSHHGRDWLVCDPV